jgi:hypothetical protein
MGCCALLSMHYQSAAGQCERTTSHAWVSVWSFRSCIISTCASPCRQNPAPQQRRQLRRSPASCTRWPGRRRQQSPPRPPTQLSLVWMATPGGSSTQRRRLAQVAAQPPAVRTMAGSETAPWCRLQTCSTGRAMWHGRLPLSMLLAAGRNGGVFPAQLPQETLQQSPRASSCCSGCWQRGKLLPVASVSAQRVRCRQHPAAATSQAAHLHAALQRQRGDWRGWLPWSTQTAAGAVQTSHTTHSRRRRYCFCLQSNPRGNPRTAAVADMFDTPSVAAGGRDTGSFGLSSYPVSRPPGGTEVTGAGL